MSRLLKKGFALFMVATFCFLSCRSITSAKSIYFAGDYRKKIGNKEYYVLQLNKYSSPEGKNIGNYALYYYYKPSGGMNPYKEGELYKTGKKNYYKMGNTKIKIYKKKLVVKSGAYKGTYKLHKRYPRP